MMKRILPYIILILLAVSCQKSYEKHYDLAVDATSYTLPATGDSFPLYVYCSGNWTACFETEVSWITMAQGTESGKGVSAIRIGYEDNDVALREVNLVIRSGEESITIHFEQKYDSTHLEVI